MKELKIYEGGDYNWGWDKVEGKPDQLGLHLTPEGAEKLAKVFGDKRRRVTMTVISGDGPDYVLVKA